MCPACCGSGDCGAPENKESQEICFIPDNDYRAFIQAAVSRMGLPLPGPGPVLHTGGELLGRHQGLWRYTQGQRRGLGIAHHEPLYVLGKDVRQNAPHRGSQVGLRQPGVPSARAQFSTFPWSSRPTDIVAQIRYRPDRPPQSSSASRNTASGWAFPKSNPTPHRLPGSSAPFILPRASSWPEGTSAAPSWKRLEHAFPHNHPWLQDKTSTRARLCAKPGWLAE